MSRRTNLRILTEAACMVALAWVLSLITLFIMPQGGKITAGSMIPILLIGLRHGTKWGILTGVVYGLVDLLTGGLKNVVHPAQLLLDWPIAFGMLGLAGLAAGKRNQYLAGAASALALTGRFAAHLFSGVFFFAQFAPEGQNVWVYSAVYNASYILPEMVISGIILAILYPVLSRAFPLGSGSARGAA
jgi:thiamine transporter